MGNRVIQAYFPGGQAPAGRLPFSHPPQAGRDSASTRAVVQAFRPGPPTPAFCPRPAPRPLQAQGGCNGFAVEPHHLGLNRGGGQPLPSTVLAKMEAAFSTDFSAVRIHEGPQAARIGALAFTIGTDIYFAPGRYRPESISGQQLLGHELTHVLQQRQGRVRAPAGAALAVVQDPALEAEADRRGRQAAASMARGGAGQPIQPKPISLIVQRMLSSTGGGSGDDPWDDPEPWKKFAEKNAKEKHDKKFTKKKVAPSDEEKSDGEEEKKQEVEEKISKSALDREFPYGGKNITPHIHQYGGGLHLKKAGGSRLNLFQGGMEYTEAINEAQEYADSLILSHPNLKKILDALIKKYRK